MQTGRGTRPVARPRRRVGWGVVAVLAALVVGACAPEPPPAPAVGTTTTTAALPGGITRLDVAPAATDPYSRSFFGSGWTDADHDCQDTRAEVLIVETRVAVTFTAAPPCVVATGRWVDPWSGTTTDAASSFQIDHTVPLANAWRSGAWAWTAERRIAFANDLSDPDHLVAVPSSENASKGDRGPEAWRPPDRSSWCHYARAWTAIKARWGLTATPAEWSALLDLAATC